MELEHDQDCTQKYRTKYKSTFSHTYLRNIYYYKHTHTHSYAHTHTHTQPYNTKVNVIYWNILAMDNKHAS